MRNALYIQSGGPTAVINCSACGVIRECQELLEKGGKLYASLHGIDGLLHDHLYDCTDMDEMQLQRLENTPSMAFGPADIQCERILARIMTGYLQH
ncbi:MAG: hypothetical protein V8Q57_00995 [Blautia sp.]